MKRIRLQAALTVVACAFALVAVFVAPNALVSTQSMVADSVSGQSPSLEGATAPEDGDSSADSDDATTSASGADLESLPQYQEGEVLVTFDGSSETEAALAAYPGVSSVEPVVSSEGSSTVLVSFASDTSVSQMQADLAQVSGVSATQKNFCYYLLDADEDQAAATSDAVAAAAQEQAASADSSESSISSTAGSAALGFAAQTAAGGSLTASAGQTFEALEATNDPACNDSTESANQYYLYNADVIDAWDYAKTEHTISVAVLDSGCNLKHADLVDNLDVDLAWDASTDTALAEEGLANNGDPYGHGTHVCGIIAAEANNNLGIAGVSYNANIIPVRILNANGSCTTATITKGLQYVEDLVEQGKASNLRVVNLSVGGYWGDTEDDAALHAVVTKLYNNDGVVCVCAGGNGNGSTKAYTTKIKPADYDECISVTCLDRDGTNTVYSDYNECKDISAPGRYIYSTSASGAYTSMSGTSMASPLVAGVMALEFSVNPELSVEDAREALLSTATEVPYDSVRDGKTGSAGCVNAEAAVCAVSGSFAADVSTEQVSQGETAHFKCTVTNADASKCTYLWQYSTDGTSWHNSPAEGNKTATLSVPATAWRLKAGYEYRCIVLSGAGLRTVSDPIGFDVALEAAASTSCVELGATGKLTCTVTGLGAATASYQWVWSSDGGATWKTATAKGNKTKTLSATVTQARAGYVYRCVIAASDGRAAITDPIAFSVEPCALASTSAVEVGDTAEFVCKVFGVDATDCSYQWQYSLNGTKWYNSPAAGNTTATLSVPATTWRLKQGNRYRCIVTVPDGDQLQTDAITFDIID